MPQFKYTKYAESDLKFITESTLKNWGNRQVDIYLDGLEELLQHLANFPDLGADRNDITAALMSFPYISHILYYTKQSHGITIIRILHKRMDPVRHFSSP